jgi:patatin-like phospholipase/acyl hydrolase
MDINRDVAINVVLLYLQQKTNFSDLEKDILSTAYKYNEQPFDRKGAELKVTENNAKHTDIFVTISSAPGICTKPFAQCSDEEVKNNLYMQLGELCLKEQIVQGSCVSLNHS